MGVLRLNVVTVMSRVVALAVAGVLMLSVTGCGEAGDFADSGDSGDRASTPGQPSPTVSADLPATPSAGRGRFMTIRGTIEPGVEAGCLILTTSHGVYLLVGPQTAGLTAGMTVEVKGAPDDTVATACQQGIPFIVTEVHR